MSALIAAACIFASILVSGLLSFLMMFHDVAPSQHSYWWPFLIPVGFCGVVVTGVAAIAVALL